MATAALTSQFQNFAELQAALGNIPAWRIRLVPPPGQATEEDLLAVEAHEGRLCELVDGTLVEKDMATFQSRLAATLIYFIELFLEDHDLGTTLAPDGFLRLFPGCVRAPDVSFISWRRMPTGEFPTDAIAALAPDLAVEILSINNTEAEIARKLREYFQSGCKLVWIVDPDPKTVRVYTSPRKSVLLVEEDTLEGGRVLPGFSLSIRKWFERAIRKGRK
jgi:Uma2 family endonuclease